MRCLRLSRGPALPFRLGQVISVALLRDCWPEIKATLPAVARAKIGAALAEEPAPFTPRTAATASRPLPWRGLLSREIGWSSAGIGCWHKAYEYIN